MASKREIHINKKLKLGQELKTVFNAESSKTGALREGKPLSHAVSSLQEHDREDSSEVANKKRQEKTIMDSDGCA